MTKIFELKKKEIEELIEHSFRLDGNPKMDGTHKYLIKHSDFSKLTSMISQLQQPKPLTCSSCKETGMCAYDLVENINYDLTEDDFGCINHSGYVIQT